jgi:hypothetical protein
VRGISEGPERYASFNELGGGVASVRAEFTTMEEAMADAEAHGCAYGIIRPKGASGPRLHIVGRAKPKSDTPPAI